MGIRLIANGADFSNSSIGRSFYIPKLSNLTHYYLGDDIKKNIIDNTDATVYQDTGITQGTHYTTFSGAVQTNYIDTGANMFATGRATALMVKRCASNASRVILNRFDGTSTEAPVIIGNAFYAKTTSGWASTNFAHTAPDTFCIDAVTAVNGTNAVTACYEMLGGTVYKVVDTTNGTPYTNNGTVVFGGNPLSAYGDNKSVDIAAVMLFDDVLTTDELEVLYGYLRNKFMKDYSIVIS